MQSVSKPDPVPAATPVAPSANAWAPSKGPRKKRRRPMGKKRKPEAFPYPGKRSAPKPSGGAVVAVAFLVDATTRSIFHAPRIETRQFFQPHEIRNGHKFLLSESRRSFEETLRDVPDIETRDLEKIVRSDLERAIVREFWKNPTVISIIQTV